MFFTVRCIFKTKFVSVTIMAFNDVTKLANEVSVERSDVFGMGVGLA